MTQEEFDSLADRWRSETACLSSITRKSEHECYLKIIAAGTKALPFIYKDLEKESEHWFTALYRIYGKMPFVFPVEYAGQIAIMREYWLAYGRKEGFL